jgi:lauroyl/myristoyl acyltransferase
MGSTGPGKVGGGRRQNDRGKIRSRSRTGVLVNQDRPGQRPWTRQDTATLAQLPVGLALAWLAEEAAWRRLAYAVAWDKARRRPAWLTTEADWIGRIVRNRLDAAVIRRAAVEAFAEFRVRQLQFMRVLRPGGWHPIIRLEGREHLDRALARGNGVILWVAPFIYASLITKMTCARNGLQVSHLSRWYHGASRSRWGIRVLNGYQRRAEDRFLDERIVIGPGEAGVAATRQLVARLRRNGIVSITVGSEGASSIRIPFMDGVGIIANGAVKLASQTNAALIPVITLRDDAGRFITSLQSPLDVGRGPLAVQQTVRALGAVLEHHVLAASGQLFWRIGVVQPAEAAGPPITGTARSPD